jgi:hypothetical protein
MTDASYTTPRKVLRRATELGVHADCVASDFEGSCDHCIAAFHEAFHEFYGHLSAEDAMQAIVRDLLRDRSDG